MRDTTAISRLLEVTKTVAHSFNPPDVLDFLVFVTPFSSAPPGILEILKPDVYVRIIGDYISWHVRCFV